MKPLGYILMWLTVVVCFSAFGFAQSEGHFPSPYAIEPIIVYAALGVGSASYAVAGLIVIMKLRGGSLGKGVAAVILFASAVASVMVPVLIVMAVAMATRRSASDTRVELFGGEHGLWIFAVCSYSFWITLCLLFVFASWALVLAKNKPNQPIAD